jgi:adenylate kinase family enzyme
VDLSHVLWIGGPQASGKSTVARAIAERFGLQLYVVDHRVWVHESRMPATEFSSLSMDERWVHASPQRMLDWFVTHSRHRFRLVLEDLRELPDEPAAIVEGSQLFPTSVSAVLRAPDQALFLAADSDVLEERLRARGPVEGTSDGARARDNAVARDLLIAQRFAREAAELRLLTVRADAPVDVVVERAAVELSPVIDRLPRGGHLAAVRRFEEEVLQAQVRLDREWLGAASAAGGTSR